LLLSVALLKNNVKYTYHMNNSLQNINDNAPITYGIMRDFITSFMNEAFEKSEARMMKYIDNSIEELAGMTARRFDSLESRLDSRIDNLESRFDGLEARLDKRIDDLEAKMEYRFSGVQNQLDNIYIDKVPRREISLLSVRVKKVEKKLGIA